MAPTPFSVGSAATIRDHFLRLFEYDHKANTLVLDAFVGLGDRLPPKPLGRMCHLLICKQLWIARMGGPLAMPDDLFPLWPLEEARTTNDETAQEMAHWIESLADADFQASFRYQDMKGDGFESIRGDIFTQLALHGSYHRGQIAVEVNPLLAQPLTTDLVYLTRQPVTTG